MRLNILRLMNWKVWCLIYMLVLITACAQPDDKALGMANLALDPDSKAIVLNDTFQYTATFTDARGDELDNITLTWASSDESIATVSSDGTVTGIAVGQAQISAMVTTDDAGLTSSNVVILTVTDDPSAVATVKINNTTSAFFVGDNEQLTAEAFNINDEVIMSSSIIWSSSDENIALIDETNGNVQFLSSGTALLSATIDGISSADFVVSVRNESQSRIANFQRAAHAIGGTATLQVNDSGNLEVVFSDDFSVDDGPGLEVFLSKQQTPNQTSANLGSLKSISGGQTYTVPSSIMIDDFDWVVIHCVPYNIVFGRGMLQ